MIDKEIWLPVKEYEVLYEVSNLGNVRSLGNGNSNNSIKRILSPGLNKSGYLTVVLYKNGKGKSFLVHRLVAEAFLPNWFDYTQVNHIDEDKTNNNVDNLEWCDHNYNCNYGTRNKRAAEKLSNREDCSKPILQLTKTGELVREWPSIHEAGRNGFEISNICYCCKGNRNHHKGYIWKYK